MKVVGSPGKEEGEESKTIEKIIFKGWGEEKRKKRATVLRKGKTRKDRAWMVSGRKGGRETKESTTGGKETERTQRAASKKGSHLI